MKKKITALLFALLLIFSLSVFAFADAGDFSGDSDFGGDWGSGSDWDSGSDWGGSDWGDSDDYYYVGSGSGGGGYVTWKSFLIMAIFVVAVIRLTSQVAKRKNAQDSTVVQPGPQKTAEDGSYAAFKQQHPDFDESAFVQMISNRYVQMQNAWTAKDWEPMRGVLSDALYTQFERQLDALIRNEYTNHVERISVLSVRPLAWKQDSQNDNLIVELYTRIVDYTVRDADGTLVSGSKTAEKFMTYEWTLTRSKDFVKTEEAEAVGHVCPNCGAPLDVNESTKCAYCGQTITVSKHDWVVSAIRGISQRTNG